MRPTSPRFSAGPLEVYPPADQRPRRPTPVRTRGGSSRFVVSCYPAQGSMRMRVPARLRGNFWGDAHPPGRTGVQHPGAGAEDDRLDLTSRFVLVFLSDSDPGAVGQKPILNLDT